MVDSDVWIWIKGKWEIFITTICITKQLNLHLLLCNHNQKLLKGVYEVYIGCRSVTNRLYLAKGKSHYHLRRLLQQKTFSSCGVATDLSLANINCNNQNKTKFYFVNNIWLRRRMSHSQQNCDTLLSVCTQFGFWSQSHKSIVSK